MKKILILYFSCLISFQVFSQDSISIQIKNIYSNALTVDVAYKQLEKLCKEAPGRLIGTPNSFKAVELMQKYLNEFGYDTVFLQKFTSPAWICHSASASIFYNGEQIELTIDALGPSASTPKEGVTAEIVEVFSLEEVMELGKEKIEGKIVFYNRPFDNTLFNTFRGYSGAVDQRYQGPSVARDYGAIASITRSATGRMDDNPHTGSCGMRENKIPAVAISTMDAEFLHNALAKEPNLQITLKVDAEDIVTNTYNLIADIKGSEKPDEYIVVGGHIDAWHNTEGAHDNGVGCLQATEVLRLFKESGIRPKRSIRAIMYMDEELYQSGGKAYKKYSEENNIKNYFAMESDAGGFTPRFFTINASDEIIKKIQAYTPYLNAYGVEKIIKGGSGVDIGPLKELGVPLSGYRPDWQRYFDMHHCAYDTFDKINFREMQLGSGAMTVLIYLIDKYDLCDKD